MWTHRRSGLTNQRGQHDHRDPYERDRTRVIHSAAFRRLQRKTQILGTHEGDFHRTRLTHSLEVASIGRSIVRNLATNSHHEELSGILPTDDLISAICLLHDIGHPPFGHGGEVALNFMMRDHGGFEGNGQTLRLLTKVENSYGEYGLDLTRRVLLGVLKYPVKYSEVVCPDRPAVNQSFSKVLRINDWLPPKAYFDCEEPEVQWLLESFQPEDRELFQSLSRRPNGQKHGKAAYNNFDCSIMNTADDIAYGVHDLEDAIHLQLIHRYQLDTEEFREKMSEDFSKEEQQRLLDQLFSPESYARKQAIGELVNYFITSVDIGINHESFENRLLRHNIVLRPSARALLDHLTDAIFNHVIDSQEARTFEYGGQTVILRLFEAIEANPTSLLNNNNRLLFEQQNKISEAAGYRVICDYIANMTDEYAYRMHERLFGLNKRTVFERL